MELKNDIYNILAQSVSDYHLKEIFGELVAEIESDVEECSGLKDDGEYNEDDIKIAFGRILMHKLGLA